MRGYNLCQTCLVDKNNDELIRHDYQGHNLDHSRSYLECIECSTEDYSYTRSDQWNHEGYSRRIEA